MNRRVFLKRAGATAALGLLRIPAHAQDASPPPLVMQLGWIWDVEFAGQIVAQEKGYYKAEGINLEIHPGGPQVDDMVMLMARKAVMSITDVMTAGQAASHGAKVKIIGSVLQKVPFSITSLPDQPIRTPKDMVGKKIGVPSKEAWTIKFLCETNHVDLHSVTILPAGYDPAPLVNHQVDGFMSFVTKQPVQLAQKGIPSVSMLMADFGLNEFSDCLAVREESLQDPVQRAALKKILRATIRGWQDAVDDPAQAAKAVTTHSGAQYGLDEAVQTKSLQGEIPLVATAEAQKNGLLTMSEGSIAANIETMGRVGLTIKRDLFDTTLIQEVMDGRARL